MDQSERYLTRLRRALVCPREDRERLLEDAKTLLESFAQENPGAFYKDYVESFGQPEDFAAEMLANLDPEDVAEVRLRRKRFTIGTAAAVGVILILLAGIWFGRQSRQGPVQSTPPPAVPTAEPTASPDTEPSPGNSEAPEGAGAEDYVRRIYDDADEITHREAVALLTKLGIVQGTGDGGRFDPSGTVTRAEGAKLITLIMNGGDDPVYETKETPSFIDIQGHWAESYIEYCVDLGILFGQGNGAFDPNGEISALALMKMAFCALGYDANAYRLTGEDWAVRVDELARTRDPSLYTGLEAVSMTEPCTRDVAAQILCNTLRSTPKVVVPVAYVLANGEQRVEWEYRDATKDVGVPSDLLWERFGLDWADISFD